jgi:hypothetical protein
MAVYVDSMKAAFGRMVMCHMLADTTAELLDMARKIGVDAKWIQYGGTHREHFDVCLAKRKRAVELGAKEVDMRQVGELLRARRQQASQKPAATAGGSFTFCDGDMFDRPADIRINTVNCVGVMGKGIALEFKKRYPQMFAAYARACRDGEVQVGSLHVFAIDNLQIINFPTKQHWRDGSQYQWISDGLHALRRHLLQFPGHHVTIPALGCSNGGLLWPVVGQMTHDILAGLPLHIFSYQPHDWPNQAASFARSMSGS